MTKEKLLIGLAALLGLYSMSAEAATMYKCIDKDGHVQYLSVRPPDCKTDNTTVLDKGHAKPYEPPRPKGSSNTGTGPSGAEETPEQIEQKRSDNALLGTYSSEDEIDQALKRNLSQLDVRINNIQNQIKSAQEDIDRLAKEKSAALSSGKTIDKGLQDEIVQANSRMTRLLNEQAKAHSDSEEIKAKFAGYKKRYRELTVKQ